jgi:hypothetical protein
MKKLSSVVLVLAAGGIGLTMTASANSAKSPAKTRHTQAAVEALTIDGNRIAYDVGSTLGKANNRVFVWNVRTGRTTKVSGKHTRTVDDSSTGSGVFQLALAGTRVAWLANVGGNSEGDDYLFTSSVTKPKERQIATVMRNGDNCPGRSLHCAGQWLGGLVGSGSSISLNRWTTDDGGVVTDGGLYALSGATMKSVATGPDTVQAAAADRGRVAVLRADGSVGLYTSDGSFLRTVDSLGATAVALSGHSLVVLTKTRMLESYYAPSGTPSKLFSVQGSQAPRNLDVQGTIAIYTIGGSVHALNLGNRKDRVVGKLRRGIGAARISSAGLVYSSNRFASKGTLVFIPFARVAAAVR